MQSSRLSTRRSALRSSKPSRPRRIARVRRLLTTGLFAACSVFGLSADRAEAQYAQVATGDRYTIALRGDGTLSGFGVPDYWSAPALPPGTTYVEVAAGGCSDWAYSDWPFDISLALRSDGAVVMWGQSFFGQFDVPDLPAGLSYTAIAAGNAHAVALRSDGTIAAWGYNASGQCTVPALPPGVTYVEVSAGGWTATLDECSYWWPHYFDAWGYTLARRSDGVVVGFGNNTYGQLNVPSSPSGLDYVEISAGSTHAAALLSDGTVIAWGHNAYGQCNVPPAPAGLSYVDVEAGGGRTVARLSDGSVVGWGNGGPSSFPAPPNGMSYVDVAVGGTFWTYNEVDGGACSYGYVVAGYSEGAYSQTIALRSDGALIDADGNRIVELNKSSYCSSTTNSSGCAATIDALGSSNLIVDEFELVADCVPDGPFMFFHGPARQQAPFGDGSLCIGGSLVRILPAGFASGGTAQAVIDLASVGITSPGVHCFQCFFRDPAAGGSGFNLSDAIEVTFVP